MKKYFKTREKNGRNSFDIEVGDRIVIQEKLDGANASIEFEDGVVVGNSRRKRLSETERLRGFYGFFTSRDMSALPQDCILFGEWLVSHSVKYKKEAYQEFYCFDIYNKTTKAYLGIDEVRSIVAALNMTMVPELYDGPFVSEEHISGFVGVTTLGEDKGEGVIVKNYNAVYKETVVNSDGEAVEQENTRYHALKVLESAFKEKQEMRLAKGLDNAENRRIRALEYVAVSTVITDTRIEKLYMKLVDEGVLPEGAIPKSKLKIVAQSLPQFVIDDCKEEDRHVMDLVGDNFVKIGKRIIMDYVIENIVE